MAQQVTAAQLAKPVIAALNVAHSLTYTGQVHNDGPEWSNADTPVEQVIYPAQPSNLTEAFAFLAAAKTWWNLHLGYADASPSDHIFAHKVADGANILTSSAFDYATYTAAARTALILLLNDLYTQYENHRKNSGGTWHTAVDTENYIGTSLTITGSAPDSELVERLNLLKALVNDHVVLTSGGVHSSADTGDVTAIPNAIYSGGIDYATAILLINDLRTKLIAHMGSATYHAAADTVNLVTVGAMTVTAGFNTLINEMITKYPTHIASTTYHNVADSTNTLSASSVSSLGQVLAAAQDLYTQMQGHSRMASVDRAFRLIS